MSVVIADSSGLAALTANTDNRLVFACGFQASLWGSASCNLGLLPLLWFGWVGGALLVGDGSAKVFKNSISLKKVPPPHTGVTLCNGYITVIYQTELMMPASGAVRGGGGEKKSFRDSSKLLWK